MNNLARLRELMKESLDSGYEMMAAAHAKDTFENDRYHLAQIRKMASDKALRDTAINLLPALIAVAEASEKLDSGLLDMGESYRCPADLAEQMNKALAELEGVRL